MASKHSRLAMGGIAAVIFGAVFLGVAPVVAEQAAPHSALVLAQAPDAASITEFSSQRRRARRRARTRLRVTPLRRAYRQCVDWYAVEHRPSGTVITPQMRCWWVSR